MAEESDHGRPTPEHLAGTLAKRPTPPRTIGQTCDTDSTGPHRAPVVPRGTLAPHEKKCNKVLDMHQEGW